MVSVPLKPVVRDSKPLRLIRGSPWFLKIHVYGQYAMKYFLSFIIRLNLKVNYIRLAYQSNIKKFQKKKKI